MDRESSLLQEHFGYQLFQFVEVDRLRYVAVAARLEGVRLKVGTVVGRHRDYRRLVAFRNVTNQASGGEAIDHRQTQVH